MSLNLHGWPTSTRLSTKTIYRYIEQGILDGVSSQHLLRKGFLRRKQYQTPPQEHKRAKCAEKSIDNRPREVEDRSSFGHWEIDCVLSGRDNGKAVLLTLVERKTRKALIRKLKHHTAEEVVHTLDMIEREVEAKTFRKTFQTITADNGHEFMDITGIERAYRSKHTQRTSIYFAHPYASSERGSNENLNGFIRRFIPKGSDIGNYSKSFIQNVEDFINNYPRRILHGFSSTLSFDLASHNYSLLSSPGG